MNWRDLTREIPETLPLLLQRGRTPTVSTLLAALGVEVPPTLHPIEGETLEVATPSRGSPARLVELPTKDNSVDRYQLGEELGRGGMGRVIQARDPELRRNVAVKMVIDPTRVNEAALGRFVAEAQITSQLEHPNIVPVYDMGATRQGQLYFVMRRVAGRSLREVLDELPDGEPEQAHWTRRRLLTVFSQICNAVAYAHQMGVLHRDLKPDNVMLGRFGEVLVMDWGVARLMGDTTEATIRSPVGDEAVEHIEVARTVDGAALGTPGYMSPEQLLGELHLLDARSDVWSLGAILYELLTWRPAYAAGSLPALVFAVTAGPPEDPRSRAPDREVPAEIAGVCMKALSPGREDRYPSVIALREAVEEFLEGSRQREAAAMHLEQAQQAWATCRALDAERLPLRELERSLSQEVPAWASLEEKVELHALQQRREDLGPERARAFAETVAQCEKALARNPGHAGARRLLAEAWYARYEEAERSRDAENLLFAEDRIRAFDDGHFLRRVEGLGSVRLDTDPSGADVFCERFEQRGLIWARVEGHSLGRTPIDCPLAPGSYLLTLRAPGRRDTPYPLRIDRGGRWDAGEQPVPLFSDEAIGEGWVYVPGGPFLYGGDAESADSPPLSEPSIDGFFLRRHLVTVGEYLVFLNDLARRDPEQAWQRSLRATLLPKEGAAEYFIARPELGQPFTMSDGSDDGGLLWTPHWPVFGVNSFDAAAYTSWASEQAGEPLDLPTEQQWEKAARGVDGRVYPWGDRFDASLAKMRASRPGGPQPEPVGSFPTDRSVYGAEDMAGLMREFCAGGEYDGRDSHRPVRGGSWLANARFCRVAHRVGHTAWNADTNHSFRLARPAPEAGEQ